MITPGGRVTTIQPAGSACENRPQGWRRVASARFAACQRGAAPCRVVMPAAGHGSALWVSAACAAGQTAISSARPGGCVCAGHRTRADASRALAGSHGARSSARAGGAARPAQAARCAASCACAAGQRAAWGVRCAVLAPQRARAGRSAGSAVGVRARSPAASGADADQRALVPARMVGMAISPHRRASRCRTHRRRRTRRATRCGPPIEASRRRGY